MREISFRGKRTDNGEWVTGTPFIFADRCKMIQAVAVHPDFVDEGNVYYSEGFPVDPKTVDQFTGLTDKNGKKIFDGDIIRHYNRISAGEPEAFEVGKIYWNDRFCSWARTTDREVHWGYVRICNDCVYEVIGNIHDNPELLNKAEHSAIDSPLDTP